MILLDLPRERRPAYPIVLTSATRTGYKYSAYGSYLGRRASSVAAQQTDAGLGIVLAQTWTGWVTIMYLFLPEHTRAVLSSQPDLGRFCVKLRAEQEEEEQGDQ